MIPAHHPLHPSPWSLMPDLVALDISAVSSPTPQWGPRSLVLDAPPSTGSVWNMLTLVSWKALFGTFFALSVGGTGETEARGGILTWPDHSRNQLPYCCLGPEPTRGSSLPDPCPEGRADPRLGSEAACSSYPGLLTPGGHGAILIGQWAGDSVEAPSRASPQVRARLAVGAQQRAPLSFFPALSYEGYDGSGVQMGLERGRLQSWLASGLH